ncbi:MAG: peroxiredoxin [Lysobacterales bacterium]|jgi:peroxiredoxin
MTIEVGERIPVATLGRMVDDRPQLIRIGEYCAGRRVVLFAVPGAFTPTCSAYHLPGFEKHAGDFFSKGVDAIACIAVNDVFVMHAWGLAQKVRHVDMLADGNGEFAHALGLLRDSREFGMGWRAQRFALVADDGVVTHLAVEPPGEFRLSSAEAVLASL